MPSEQDIVDRYTEYVTQKRINYSIPQVYGGVVFGGDGGGDMDSDSLRYKLRFGYDQEYEEEIQTKFLYNPYFMSILDPGNM